MHGIDGARELDELGAQTLIEHRKQRIRHRHVVEGQRDLLAMRSRGQLLQRRASDEFVVEFDEESVTQLPGREVIVLDIVGDETPADGGLGLVVVHRQPFPVGFHFLAGVDGGKRRGYPARFQGIRGVAAPAHQLQAMRLARLDQGGMNRGTVGPGTHQLETRLPGHAVPQRVHFAAGDFHPTHVEEFEVRCRTAGCRLDHLRRVGSLQLIAVVAPILRIRARRRAFVVGAGHAVPADLGIEQHPIERRCPTDQIELVLRQVEQNDIADDVAIMAAGHELLGFVGNEALEAVDAEPVQKSECVRSFDHQLRHVVRLIEQNAGLLPRALLVAPVRVFGGDARIRVGPRLLIAQELNDIADAAEQRLE